MAKVIELPLSELGTKQYWDAQYENELSNFEKHGDIGEIWFEDSVDRLIEWILDTDLITTQSSVIDIGCGNGAFLLNLAAEGFTNLHGIDYSQKAVQLAQAIAAQKDMNITYKQVDIVCSNEENLAVEEYDVCHDKGTYDAVSMCPDDASNKREAYMKAVHRMMHNNSLFVITSCNWTQDELVEQFSYWWWCSPRLLTAGSCYLLTYTSLSSRQPSGLVAEMDAESLRLAERFLPSTYLKQARDADISRRSRIHQLLEKRKCPDEGWDDQMIEGVLVDLSKMDSNNFPANCGVGERESRIFSGLVAQRHYRLGHGIGRSGDISEVQPKAAGSSLLNKLTNAMVLDLIRRIGIRGTQACLVMPMATGMTVMMTLLSLRDSRPQAKYVLWPRIDQKSCLKAIVTAGYQVVVIENVLEGDELKTDVPALREKVSSLGAEHVVAILTTTSCFAPRGIDRIEEVAKVCKEHNIPHIVNNAYGLQSTKCLHHIQQAGRVGRVDAFIQSTDKNFMVPVGGAVVAGFDAHFIEHIAKMYPGRASVSPVLDLFITLLSMGVQGYTSLLTQRSQHMDYLRTRLGEVANTFHLQLLQTKNNPISMGITVPDGAGTELGSQLFLRGVSGVRVVVPNQIKTVAGVTLKGWGGHYPNYPHGYLTAAAALGMEKVDVDRFIGRLEKCLKKQCSKLREREMEGDDNVLDSL